MTWVRRIGRTVYMGSDAAVVRERRPIRSTVLGAGTLACHHCDAPIAPAVQPLLLTDSVACPFCDACGPVRDFLSLAAPTRPARVVVRVAPVARR